MDIEQAIALMRERYEGFNDPVPATDIALLQRRLGQLPTDVLALYRDHDGSDARPEANGELLPARLLPVNEVMELQGVFDQLEPLASMGWESAVLWTDDNSNYAGVYTDGPLTGFLFLIDHEEQVFTPGWRSATNFVEQLLASAPSEAGEDDAAYDVTMVARDLPAARVDDLRHVDADRRRVVEMRRLYGLEKNADARRLYAQCAMVLTPVTDTAEIVSFLDDDDMWTPQAAVDLLEDRSWRGNVVELEQLARRGTMNGDSAAMRLLVRMETEESRAAVERLRTGLTGQKAELLEQHLRIHRRNK